MSHQTRYQSKFVNVETLSRAMDQLGFTPVTTHNPKHHQFRQSGMPVVTIIEHDTFLEISTDLHLYSSRKLVALIGNPEDGYENLATLYNTYEMTNHLEAQGCEVQVEESQEGEMILMVSNQGWN